MYSLLFLLELVLFIALLIPTITALVTGAPWVPTPEKRVRRMLKLAQIKPGDYVIDPGCGDGRIPHLAAKLYGAQAVGYELSPLIYLLARIRNFIVRSQSRVVFRDFRREDFRQADAILCYLMPETLKRMRPKLEQELPAGARLVSYAFQVEGWMPVFVEPKNPAENLAPIYVYEMPTSKAAKDKEASA